MGYIFATIGFLGIIINGVMTIKAFIQKKPKKNYRKWTMLSLAVFVLGILLVPTATLKMDAQTVETDKQGVALIKGETDADCQVTIDGESVPVKNQQFSYKVTLKNSKEKKITVLATKGSAKNEQTITVKPSKVFVASLNKKSDTQLKEVETALKTAETAPSQANYDAAATLVASLSKEYDQYTKRLATIKENIATYEALEQAEKTGTKEDYEAANTLVAKATLNKKAWTKRLAAVKETIDKKEQEAQLLAAATTALEQAEKDPTNETLYNDAVAKIDSLPVKNEDLTNRLTTVKQKLEDHKNQQKAQAAAAKEAQQAEQQAAEQQAAAEQTPAEPATSGNYLATRTGKKYHSHKCGSGDYYPTTEAEIKNRGLEPCRKCFPQ